MVPLNVLLKGREVAYHLDDSDAKAYFCFEGTDELPIGQAGHDGFSQTDGCEHFFLITADPAAESPIEGAETLGAGMGTQPPTFETVETDEDDTAVILYTSGTTGPAEGRRAAAPQHARQRADRDGPLRRRRRQPRHLPLRAAAVPLLRPDRDPERRLRLRRHRRPPAPVRGRGRARPDAEGEGHLLRRRPDDVLGAARRARRTTSTSRRSPRTCGWPWPAGRRYRSRCTRTSRRSSA